MKNKITTQAQLNKLAAFRQSVYGCLTRARDALFELLDAVLTSPGIGSFPELSCAPSFRRQWPSVYEALQDGKLDAPDLLKLELEQLPPLARPLLVGDHTAWGRVHARTLPAARAADVSRMCSSYGPPAARSRRRAYASARVANAQ